MAVLHGQYQFVHLPADHAFGQVELPRGEERLGTAAILPIDEGADEHARALHVKEEAFAFQVGGHVQLAAQQVAMGKHMLGELLVAAARRFVGPPAQLAQIFRDLLDH